MCKRYVAIGFPYLLTDWWTIRKPGLKQQCVVITAPDHGRMVITAVNRLAQLENIMTGMVLADARAVVPSLHVIDERPLLAEKVLQKIARWCIRFTPVTAIQFPDGIILDCTGCTHLWGGDEKYLTAIIKRIESFGYHVQAAMADTVGAAWGFARFANKPVVIKTAQLAEALQYLPPAALRLDAESLERLHKLGLRKIKDFIHFPRQVLFRRFGHLLIQRLQQALGEQEELIEPLEPIIAYSERLPCLEPIVTATGIEIAMQRLIGELCNRLKSEENGLRKAVFKCYRIDHEIRQTEISTSRPSSNVQHILKLLQAKISNIEPGPGIELFVLEAPVVEPHVSKQETLWETAGGIVDPSLSELVDRLSSRIGKNNIQRYEAAEHYWPERSYQSVTLSKDEVLVPWKVSRPRPVHLLKEPQHIEVTAPIPDYPPMLFRYNGKLHKVVKADGPERIEQEWWISYGEHRDYYVVEDEEGCRYWLFRSGHYEAERAAGWYVHGFFA